MTHYCHARNMIGADSEKNVIFDNIYRKSRCSTRTQRRIRIPLVIMFPFVSFCLWPVNDQKYILVPISRRAGIYGTTTPKKVGWRITDQTRLTCQPIRPR